mmetsp:Transcript_1239/g.2078  ORF Transcript_1239/g.2078 Transcript_1239/m.2078 type:complete len:222 (-) Transcript_1239:555-1220(-)
MNAKFIDVLSDQPTCYFQFAHYLFHHSINLTLITAMLLQPKLGDVVKYRFQKFNEWIERRLKKIAPGKSLAIQIGSECPFDLLPFLVFVMDHHITTSLCNFETNDLFDIRLLEASTIPCILALQTTQNVMSIWICCCSTSSGIKRFLSFVEIMEEIKLFCQFKWDNLFQNDCHHLSPLIFNYDNISIFQTVNPSWISLVKCCLYIFILLGDCQLHYPFSIL